jgi:small GTP-binding protein
MKIVLIGPSGAGKTSLFHKVQKHEFTTHAATTGPTQAIITIRNGSGDDIRMAIWDTGGQDHVQSLAPIYVSGAQAVLFTYNVMDPDSFQALDVWQKFVFDRLDLIPSFVVGTQIDRGREVSTDEARAWGERLKAPLFETSAKTGVGIHELFTAIANQCTPASVEAEVVEIRQDPDPEPAGCCIKSFLLN